MKILGKVISKRDFSFKVSYLTLVYTINAMPSLQRPPLIPNSHYIIHFQKDLWTKPLVLTKTNVFQTLFFTVYQFRSDKEH